VAEKDCPATGVTGPGGSLPPCLPRPPRVARGDRAQRLAELEAPPMNREWTCLGASFCCAGASSVADAINRCGFRRLFARPLIPGCRGYRESDGGAGDAAPGGGSRRQPRDGDAGTWKTVQTAPPDTRHRESVPDQPSGATQAPRGAGLARPTGRERRWLTGRHAAVAACCA